MEHLKAAICILLFVVISNVTAVLTEQEADELLGKEKANSPAVNPKDLELNSYVSRYAQANDAATKIQIANEYQIYLFQRNALLNDINNMIQRADMLSQHPRLAANQKPVVEYIKKNLEKQEKEANNQGLVNTLRESLNILAEILLANGISPANIPAPATNIPAAVTNIPATATNIPEAVTSSILSPSVLNWLYPSNNPLFANWLYPSKSLIDLTDKELKNLKSKLDDVDSDEDIWDCFSNIFG